MKLEFHVRLFERHEGATPSCLLSGEVLGIHHQHSRMFIEVRTATMIEWAT
jgi:hypothetical protein